MKRPDAFHQRSSDGDLFRFTYRIFQVKFVVFECVLLGCFLYVLYLVVKHELGF
ncbi:MAG: hypothetical protein ABSH32_24860 [Bryobacteraceae bacterium]